MIARRGVWRDERILTHPRKTDEAGLVVFRVAFPRKYQAAAISRAVTSCLRSVRYVLLLHSPARIRRALLIRSLAIFRKCVRDFLPAVGRPARR